MVGYIKKEEDINRNNFVNIRVYKYTNKNSTN